MKWPVSLCLLVLSLPVAAQALRDPTRPPDAFVETSGAVVGGPRLESVLLPVHGKPLAIIGGTQVALGDEYRGQRLVRVSENEVELRGNEGTEVLRLVPGIEKKIEVVPTRIRGKARGAGK